MNQFKLYFIKRTVARALLGALLGAVLLLARPYADDVLGVAVVFMGIVTVILSLPGVLLGIQSLKQRREWVSLAVATVSIAVGFMLMLAQYSALTLALVIWSVLLPAARVWLVDNRTVQAKRELPRVLLGLFVLLVYLTGKERLVLGIGGWCTVACAVLYLAAGLVVAHTRFSPYAPTKDVHEGEFEEIYEEEK